MSSFAGSYAVGYSGGTVTTTPGTATPYGYNGAWWGGSGGSSRTICSDTVTVTFKWSGPETAPVNAVVEIQSTASAYAGGGSGIATADNGEGDSEVTGGQLTFPQYRTANSGFDSNGNAIVHYAVHGGGDSFTVPVNASASGIASSGAGRASVWVIAVAQPVYISTAGLQSLGSGNNDAYIGQHVVSTLATGDATISTQSWSTAGTAVLYGSVLWGTSFTSRQWQAPANGLSTYNAFAVVYGSETLTASANVVFPDGTTSSVTAQQAIQWLHPASFSIEYDKMGSTSLLNTNICPTFLSSGNWYDAQNLPNPVQAGMNVFFYEYTAPYPNSGIFGYVQLVSSATVSWECSDGTSQSISTSGLDGSFPYPDRNGVLWWGENGLKTETTEDTPGMKIPEGDVYATTVSDSDQFQGFLAYVPPSNGVGVEDVPLEMVNWEWPGSAFWSGIFLSPGNPIWNGPFGEPVATGSSFFYPYSYYAWTRPVQSSADHPCQ